MEQTSVSHFFYTSFLSFIFLFKCVLIQKSSKIGAIAIYGRKAKGGAQSCAILPKICLLSKSVLSKWRYISFLKARTYQTKATRADLCCSQQISHSGRHYANSGCASQHIPPLQHFSGTCQPSVSCPFVRDVSLNWCQTVQSPGYFTVISFV